MKRFFAFLLALCLCLALTSCKDNNKDNTEVETQEVPQLADGEWKFPYNHLSLVPFENKLLNVTDVVIATSHGVSQQGQTLYYRFHVEESLRGDDIESIIEVEALAAESYDPSSGTYTNMDIYEPKFLLGERYLLLLERNLPSVYENGGYRYSFACGSTVIPFDALESHPPRISEMTVEWGDPLINYFKLEDTYRALINGSFVEYILEFVKDNPYSMGKPYIKETDMESVVCGSEYVFKVKIDSAFMESYTGDRITYECTLIESYKGDIKNESFSIVFPIDTVQKGDVCIVAVRDVGGSQTLFGMSSQNSVFDVSQKEEILDILNN